jgi:competence ComEA-like helix-hairpin-helix protein
MVHLAIPGSQLMGARQEIGILSLLAVLLLMAFLDQATTGRTAEEIQSPCAVEKKMSGAHQILCGMKVELNEASEMDLERVPGIGPKLAKRILEERDLHNGFQSVEDLLSMKGIGPKRLDQIRRFLTVLDAKKSP